jgi:putative FmdB family regulatory protein
MPTYDYQCEQCGHTFETFQSMRDDPLVDCPACSTPNLRRLITGGTGVIFKGSGFYVNDSRSGSRGRGGTGAAEPTEKADSATGKESSSGAGAGTGSSAESGSAGSSKGSSAAGGGDSGKTDGKTSGSSDTSGGSAPTDRRSA